MEGRKPEYPEKTHDDELPIMPHTKVRKFQAQPRLEPALQHWWQARKTDVLTITPHILAVDGKARFKTLSPQLGIGVRPVLELCHVYS